jgi:hypothetical protein
MLLQVIKIKGETRISAATFEIEERGVPAKRI